MPTKKIRLEHECYEGCPTCHSSGEGMHENSSCRSCGGDGMHYHGYYDLDFLVEWHNPNLSDLEIIFGDIECETCGYDFYDDIFYVMKEEMTKMCTINSVKEI